MFGVGKFNGTTFAVLAAELVLLVSSASGMLAGRTGGGIYRRKI